MKRAVYGLCVAATCATRVVSAQHAEHSAPTTATSSSTSLELVGLDGATRTVSATELAALRRVDTTVSAHQTTGRYSGVLLTDLLGLVGAPRGDSLRGKALGDYVVVEAADGYRVVFGIAEFDAGYTDRIAILADRKDGAPLTASEAPYRLIIPGDRRPARWIRQVVRISLRRAP